jgi:uncharacterized protein (UPF0332 family)
MGLISKSRAAAVSARRLYETGDYDGCANRAYYAMFDVARAYLKLRHGISLNKIKTHAGLLSAFSRVAIQDDGLDPELGRALNRATNRRATADYDEGSIEREAAARMLDDMALFLDALLKEIDTANRGLDT